MRIIAKFLEPKELQKKANKILKMAADMGLEENYFFLTTFQRYLVQIRILDALEKEINDAGVLVTKEYVRGRENVYSHPAIADYNKTTDSANKTLGALLKIITALRKDEDVKSHDDFNQF